MLEKNIDTFAKLLEGLNMKQTALAFREEFLSKSNDEYELGKYNILKHLQNQLSKCSGDNFSHQYFPTSSKKKTYSHNEIFDNFLKKFSKKQKIDENSSKKISQESKVFLNLKKKLENECKIKLKKEKDSKLSFSATPQTINYDYENIEDNKNNQEELPCFGSNIKQKEDNEKNENEEKKEKENEEEDSLFGNNETEEKNSNRSFGNDNNLNLDETEKNINNENNSQTNSIIQSQSLIENEEINTTSNNYNNKDNIIDEYENNDDIGFDLFECKNQYFRDTCKKLAEQSDFPHRGVYKSKFKDYKQTEKEFFKPKTIENSKIKLISHMKNDKTSYEINKNPDQDEIWSHSKLTKNLNFPSAKNETFYPIFYNGHFIDDYIMKVIVDRERTGFEESKDFKIVINNLIAGRYQILAYLGNAVFSKAVKCLDIKENKLVCLKIIENNKDYFDQSLDEIKVLNFINSNGDPDEKHFLKLYDFFYFKEHLFIVTELLKDNLYDLYAYLSKNKMENYFTLPKIQKITKQILTCLDYIHSLHLIHCDLKPENILMKSIHNAQIKIIDFGSAGFVHDQISSYIQSRSYRAPEVILGCNYDYKIDIWSLGCIVAELYTGNVLFSSDPQTETVQSLLARVIGIIGPIPDWMYEKGKTVKSMFCKEKLLFMEAPGNNGKMHVIVPKRTVLKKRLNNCQDELFIDFIRFLLQIDPNERPSASQAMEHPWMKFKYEE